MNRKNKIPITVLTGFLGSGKTTLINNLISQDHGIRFAIIENEFGEVGVDQDLVLNEKEEIIEMNNGCICCTVRGDLIRIIKKLINLDNPPERIIIETTGLADPSPVAQTFYGDNEIYDNTFLDGIVTLIDAKHFLQQIDRNEECKNQVSFADMIVINKLDLVSEEELIEVENKIKELNSYAKIVKTNKSSIDYSKVFNLGGFNIDRAMEINPKFMEIEYPFEYGCIYEFEKGDYSITLEENGNERDITILFHEILRTEKKLDISDLANRYSLKFYQEIVLGKSNSNIEINKGTKLVIEQKQAEFNLKIKNKGKYLFFSQHSPQEFNLKINKNGKLLNPILKQDFNSGHTHDESVSSVGIRLEKDIDYQTFIFFLKKLIKVYGLNLYRYKGVISFKHSNEKVALQGVHMVFELYPLKKWEKNEKKVSTIIFIGKDLDKELITQSLLAATF